MDRKAELLRLAEGGDPNYSYVGICRNIDSWGWRFDLGNWKLRVFNLFPYFTGDKNYPISRHWCWDGDLGSKRREFCQLWYDLIDTVEAVEFGDVIPDNQITRAIPYRWYHTRRAYVRKLIKCR